MDTAEWATRTGRRQGARAVLEDVAAGQLTAEVAAARLAALPADNFE